MISVIATAIVRTAIVTAIAIATENAAVTAAPTGVATRMVTATAAATAIAKASAMSAAALPQWVKEPARSGVHSVAGSYSPASGQVEPRSTLAVYRRQPFRDALLGEERRYGETVFENSGARVWHTGDDIAIVSFKSRMHAIGDDVLHSLYMPAFRVKADAIPGRYSSVWFTPTQVGTFHLFCAEYCGTQHSGMIGSVTVMEPAEYQAWLSGGGGLSMVARGEQLFQQLGCVSCHLNDGTGRGPALGGKFGMQERLATGDTVQVDDSYMRESILNPQLRLVAGYQPLMPTFQGLVDEEAVMSLITYIKSLPPAQGAAATQTTAAGAAPAAPAR